MKKITTLLSCIAVIAVLSSCSSTYSGTAYSYDDIYYSPKNDKVKAAETNVEDEINSYSSPSYNSNSNNRYATENNSVDNRNYSYYQNEYANAEQESNAQNTAMENSSRSSTGYSDSYYDYEYAARLRRFHSPTIGLGYYDDFYTNRYYYDNTPAYYSASIYGGSTWYPYSGFSYGYNSLTGWGTSISIGFGWGWRYPSYYPYYSYYNPFYSPFYNPYRYYGYSPFYSNYYHGYSHGYRDGFYDGFYGDGHYGSYGRRNIYGKRSSSGTSSPYREVSSSRPERGSSSGVRNTSTPEREVQARPARPVNNGNATPIENKAVENARPVRPSTPSLDEKPVNNTYTPKTREDYAKPSIDNDSPVPGSRPNTVPDRKPTESRPVYVRPSRENNVRPNNTRPSTTEPARRPTESRPTYVRPNRNNSFNAPRRNTQPTRPQMQQQSKPSRNISRPSYNRNNSYSMPSRSNTGSFGGGSSAPSSRPSRPSR